MRLVNNRHDWWCEYFRITCLKSISLVKWVKLCDCSRSLALSPFAAWICCSSNARSPSDFYANSLKRRASLFTHCKMSLFARYLVVCVCVFFYLCFVFIIRFSSHLSFMWLAGEHCLPNNFYKSLKTTAYNKRFYYMNMGISTGNSLKRFTNSSQFNLERKRTKKTTTTNVCDPLLGTRNTFYQKIYCYCLPEHFN